MRTTSGSSKVRRGVEIDPKDNEVALARAQAALDDADAAAESLNIDVPISSVNSSSQLKFTSSDIKNAQAAIAAAEKEAAAAHARVLEAQAENVKAQDDVTRYRLLLARDEIPKQVYDHAYAAATSDVAAVSAAEASEAAALTNRYRKPTAVSIEAEARYEDAQAGRSASPPRAPKPSLPLPTYAKKEPRSNRPS